jgi:hypothetical protein
MAITFFNNWRQQKDNFAEMYLIGVILKDFGNQVGFSFFILGFGMCIVFNKTK